MIGCWSRRRCAPPASVRGLSGRGRCPKTYWPKNSKEKPEAHEQRIESAGTRPAGEPAGQARDAHPPARVDRVVDDHLPQEGDDRPRREGVDRFRGTLL